MPSGDDVVGSLRVEVAGTYGTLHLNADGSYTYTLDNSNPAFQTLPDAATSSYSFPHPPTATHFPYTTLFRSITVTGTNDAPVAVADTNSVTEDTPPNPVGGNVLTNDTDVIGGANH